MDEAIIGLTLPDDMELEGVAVEEMGVETGVAVAEATGIVAAPVGCVGESRDVRATVGKFAS